MQSTLLTSASLQAAFRQFFSESVETAATPPEGTAVMFARVNALSSSYIDIWIRSGNGEEFRLVTLQDAAVGSVMMEIGDNRKESHVDLLARGSRLSF